MKKILLSLSFFTLITASVSAQESTTLTHSYFDLGYERVFYSGQLGRELEDANGLALELSAAPTENFFLLGEYHFASPDAVLGNNGGDDSVNTQDLRLGLGGNILLGGALDLYLQTGGRYLEIPAAGAWERLDDWGLYLEPGLRFAIIPFWEIYASADYTRIAERNIWGGEVGTVFKFTDMLGVELSARFEEDRSTLGIGGRLQW